MQTDMKFMRLEGNYIVAFRDTAETLPAFTAVRLDRSRRQVRGRSTPDSSPKSRRRVSPPGNATLVITGVPVNIDLDVVKNRLEDCIPGIVKVYREKDTSVLQKPPIFVQTNRGIAVDAFMLRSEWVRAIDLVVKQGVTRVPQIILNDGGEDDFVLIPAPVEEVKVNPDELCPHGSYIAAAGNCPQCQAKNKGRRSTYISDAFLFRGDRKDSSGDISPPKSIGGAGINNKRVISKCNCPDKVKNAIVRMRQRRSIW